MIKFDYKTAIQKHTPDEIAEYLSGKTGIDYQQVRDMGYSPTEVLENLMDQGAVELSGYGEPVQAEMGDVKRGLMQGINTSQAGAYGAVGLAGSLAEKAGFEDTGKAMKDWGFKGYQRNMEEAAKYPTKQFSDVHGAGDFVDYIQGLAASQISVMAEVIIGSALTGGAGYAAAKTAISKTAKKMAQSAIEKQIKAGVLKSSAKEAAETALEKSLVKGFMKQKAGDVSRKAAKAGMVGTVAQLESGLNYGEVLDKHGIDAPVSALGFGALAASFEVMGGNIGLINDFIGGVSKKLPGSYIKRAAKRILTNAPAEALQEAGQEVTSVLNTVVNTDEKFLTPDNMKQIMESAVAGGIMGTGGGAVQGVMRKEGQAPDLEAGPKAVDTLRKRLTDQTKTTEEKMADVERSADTRRDVMDEYWEAEKAKILKQRERQAERESKKANPTQFDRNQQSIEDMDRWQNRSVDIPETNQGEYRRMEDDARYWDQQEKELSTQKNREHRLKTQFDRNQQSIEDMDKWGRRSVNVPGTDQSNYREMEDEERYWDEQQRRIKDQRKGNSPRPVTSQDKNQQTMRDMEKWQQRKVSIPETDHSKYRKMQDEERYWSEQEREIQRQRRGPSYAERNQARINASLSTEEKDRRDYNQYMAGHSEFDQKLNMMQQEVNSSETRGVTQEKANQRGETVVYGASSPSWMKDLQAERKANGEKALSRKEINVLIDKARSGQKMTDRQASQFEYIRRAMGRYTGEANEFGAMEEAQDMERKGYDLMGGAKVPVTDLNEGDKIVGTIDGVKDEYTVKDTDKNGDVLFEDGVTRRVDMFDEVSVDGIKRSGDSQNQGPVDSGTPGVVEGQAVKPDILADAKRPRGADADDDKQGRTITAKQPDILPRSGKPFQSKGNAIVAIRMAKAEDTHEAVEVDGGWVGRVKTNNTPSASDGAPQGVAKFSTVAGRKANTDSHTEYGREFKTGKPVTFDFAHNTESATDIFGIPDKDSSFGRGYEPSGRYVTHISDAGKPVISDKHIHGTITFQNPLVVKNNDLNWKKGLSQKYGGKTGKKLSKAIIADGYDGVVTIDGEGRSKHISEILDLTTFDESKAKFQTQKKPLVTVHNLSAKNVLHAKKMGGLAVPSIAITSPSVGEFDGFGEISLVADPSLIDPKESKSSKVFNADAYSPRYPSVVFKPNDRRVNKIWKELSESSQVMGNRLSTELGDSEIQRHGIGAFKNSSVVQYEYLKSVGKAPRRVYKKKPAIPSEIKRFRNSKADLVRDSAFIEAATEHYRNKIDNEKNERRKKLLESGYFNEDGELFFRHLDSLANDIRVFQRPKETDVYKMKDVMASRLKSKKAKADFDKWVEENYSDAIDGEQIPNGHTYSGSRKYLPHDLDTVVKLMKKGLKDGEGFNYGVGSIRAVTSKQFKSLAGIKKDRDKIVSKETMEEVKEEVDREFMDLVEDLKPFYKYDAGSFGYLDDASNALKEFAQRGIYGLNEYYESMPEDILGDVRSFLQKLSNLPTEYFEAKIQRAVGLDEFRYAVVPKKTSAEVKNALRDAGLTVRLYDGGIKGDRARVIGGLKKVLFQASQKPILTDKEKLNALYQAQKRNKASDKLGKLAEQRLHESLKAFPEYEKTKATPAITREQKEIEGIVRLFGHKVTFFESNTPEIDRINGFVPPNSKGELFINTKSEDPIISVVGHETLHLLKREHSDVYDWLTSQMDVEGEAFQEYYDRFIESREGEETLTTDPWEVHEELIADFAGDQFKRPEFWQKLNKENPSFTARIVNTIKEILRKIRSWGTRGEQYVSNFQESQDALAVAMGELANRAAKRVSGTTNREAKFSTATDKTLPQDSPLTQQDYLDNRKQHKNIKGKAAQTLVRFKREAAKGVDKFLGSISTRLKNVSPKLSAKVRTLDYDINTKAASDLKIALPLLKKAKNMTRDDYADWDYARKNSDKAKLDELNKKYGIEKEYQAVRMMLDRIREEAIDVGYEVGEIKEYWPRVLKDQEGFLRAIDRGPERPEFTDALKKKAKDMGIEVYEMDDSLKADVISNMILGKFYGIPGPGGVKQRVFKKIPAEFNQFYMDSDAALMQHIHSMRKRIEARRFFGKVPDRIATAKTRLRTAEARLRKLEKAGEKDKIKDVKGRIAEYRTIIEKYKNQNDFEENIGSYVLELLATGEIAPTDENTVKEILTALFNEP